MKTRAFTLNRVARGDRGDFDTVRHHRAGPEPRETEGLDHRVPEQTRRTWPSAGTCTWATNNGRIMSAEDTGTEPGGRFVGWIGVPRNESGTAMGNTQTDPPVTDEDEIPRNPNGPSVSLRGRRRKRIIAPGIRSARACTTRRESSSATPYPGGCTTFSTRPTRTTASRSEPSMRSRPRQLGTCLSRRGRPATGRQPPLCHWLAGSYGPFHLGLVGTDRDQPRRQQRPGLHRRGHSGSAEVARQVHDRSCGQIAENGGIDIRVEYPPVDQTLDIEYMAAGWAVPHQVGSSS